MDSTFVKLKHGALETAPGAEPGHLQGLVPLRGAESGGRRWGLFPAGVVGGYVEREVVGDGNVGEGVRRRGYLVAEDSVGLGGIGGGVRAGGEEGGVEGFVEEARALFHPLFLYRGARGRKEDGQGLLGRIREFFR